ncbi:M48 family metallopeptidase [Pseudodesulfovibrio sp.]|uniref:M48 family metallopeptidase n=1 Tax=Pseudodesulfovibrio sp. TaxID=2035812 RepID=UPI002610F2B4|nr:M48 family metallopeptidase [Pseudodesulfovibrio sp.]MDD3310928.1 M48 family metallopeptidase [Pseudodesulfovibrio sp.]
MNCHLVAVIAFLAGSWLLHTLSAILDVLRAPPRVPPEFADVFDPPAYARGLAYRRASARLSVIADTCGTGLLLAAILLGGFAWLDRAVRALGLSPLPTGLCYLGAVALAASLSGLPFDAWRTFGVEARFGFNKTTVATFVRDRLVGLALSVLLGAPLVAGVLLLLDRAGSAAWLWCWALVTLFSLGVTYVAPTWILPLFNTFTPLEEGRLRRAIETFARRAEFEVGGIFVVDGSRRSTKSNAFFTGLGRRKRIALFDTLVRDHAEAEIVAVLAHEVGHAKCGHIRKGLAGSVLRTGLLFFLMSLFLDSPGLSEAFGMAQPTAYAGLVFFLLLYTPISLLLGVAANWISRRREFEADRFSARTTGDPAALASALKRLSVTNLSDLTPHPLTVWLEYGHPPVLARLRALAEFAK